MGHGSSVVADESGVGRFDPPTSPLISQDLSDGYNLLVQVPSSRQAFLRYVKNGSWLKTLMADQKLRASFSSAQLEHATGEFSRNIEAYTLPRGAMPGLEHCLSKRKLSQDSGRWPISKKLDDGGAHPVPPVEAIDSDRSLDSFSDSADRLLSNLPPRLLQPVPQTSPGVAASEAPQEAATTAAAETSSPLRTPRGDFLFSQEQMKDIMFAYLFPLFLQSPEFVDWMANKPAETPFASSPAISPTQRSSSVEMGSPMARLCQAIVQTTTSMPETEMDEILQSGDWMAGFVTAVEDLKLCVTVTSAKPCDGESFPLTYVNKAFEAMTGYSRSEVIGRNCRFLQCANTEQQQVQKIREALRTHSAVKVAITNARKDGSEFMNLLALKPVCNPQGQCVYVIGVQYDVTQPQTCKSDLKKVEELLSVLPRILQG